MNGELVGVCEVGAGGPCNMPGETILDASAVNMPTIVADPVIGVAPTTTYAQAPIGDPIERVIWEGTPTVVNLPTPPVFGSETLSDTLGVIAGTLDRVAEGLRAVLPAPPVKAADRPAVGRWMVILGVLVLVGVAATRRR